MAISRDNSFRQLSLICPRYRGLVSLFYYVIKPTIVLIIGRYSTSAKFREIQRNFAKISKFGEKGQISQIGLNFRSLRKTVSHAYVAVVEIACSGSGSA